MKLTELDITTYGIWERLKLKLNPHGMTVLHGPNETGKTTVRRFIQEMLFGPAPSRRGSALQMPLEGKLEFISHQERYQITRKSKPGENSYIQLTDQRGHNLPLAHLDEVLRGQSREVYQNVFGIGLKELQEFSTLQGKEISERLYGTSLGTIGKSVLRSKRLSAETIESLFNEQGDGGTLFELGKRKRLIESQLIRQGDTKRKYQEYTAEEEKLQAKLKGLRSKYHGLEEELRGYEFLTRAWPLWNKEQQLRIELNKLPNRRKLPRNVLQKLREYEQQLKQYEQRQQELKQKHHQLKADAQKHKLPEELWEHLGSIQALIDQKEWLEQTETRLSDLKSDYSLSQIELNEHISNLGQKWSINRLAKVDTSPDANYKLVENAKRYQSAIAKRARHRKKYRKYSDAVHTKQVALQDQLKRMRVDSITNATTRIQALVDKYEERMRLRRIEEEFYQRKESIRSQLSRLENKVELPWWGVAMLWTFGFAGLFLFVAGLIRGIETAWYIGIIYTLTGLMCGGLTLALKAHFSSGVDEQIEMYRHELLEIEEEEERLLHAIEQLGRLEMPNVDHTITSPELLAIKTCNKQLATLKELAAEQAKLTKQRHILSKHRSKLPIYQREVNTARQNWCEFLRELGLDETVRIKDAMDSWQNAFKTKQIYLSQENLKEQISEHKSMLSLFRERIDHISARMGGNPGNGQSLIGSIQSWESQISGMATAREARKGMLNRHRDLKKEYRELSRKIFVLRFKTRLLFQRAKVKSLAELEKLLTQIQQADHIRERIKEYQHQLENLSREVPDLAISEHDLAAFNEKENKHRIEMLKKELSSMEYDFDQVNEQLGRLHGEHDKLLKDRTEIDLRYELAQIDGKMKTQLESYLGAQLATSTISHLQKKLERTSQSKTLKDASYHFEHLSHRRYKNLWSPLGSMELHVDDQNDRTLPVEALSDGAREQLFLSIRLAMIDDMYRRNIGLPILMDDLMVNFDRKRTITAIDRLTEFVEDGRQLLFFTCHDHIVDEFKARDITTIDLSQRVIAEESLLAG